jgi:glutathione S-transferase
VSEIIFHHYTNSPFSEKVRLIFGFKKIVWNSVMIPPIMPKPNVVALTGGYRRTPVMQIGADIYCDTELISDALERVQPTPTLYPRAIEGAARTLAQWADTTLFWTVIPYVFQPAGVQDLMAGLTPEQLKAFGADRAAFRGNAPRVSVAEAAGSLAEYLRRLENMLADGRSFLLGADPSIADFSVYHCLWFLKRARALASIMDSAVKLNAWMERMAAFGHHESKKMDAERALEIARSSTPADTGSAALVDVHGVALGDKVAIMPADYGIDPVEGELVLSTATEFAVRRTDPMAGTVVVHFPRLGFQLKKA